MLKNKIAEHILSVTIDLSEAQQELIDTQIKINDLGKKLNELIAIQNTLQNANSTDNNDELSDIGITYNVISSTKR